MTDNLEITSAYWEARIKTYGFHRVTDLRLFGVDVGGLDLSALGHALCDMGEEGIPLVLTFAQATSQGLAARIVVPLVHEALVRQRLQEAVAMGGNVTAREVAPVEVIFFYGPHFGDRYGIAEVALRCLAQRGIHATATACSGSCVYLVLPEGRSEEALRVLSETFDIPRAPSRRPPEET